MFGDRQICLCRELTKKFEEYIRGNISEIIPICESLKGEMVLVVQGYQEVSEEAISLDECVKLVDKKINEGLSTKEAIKIISLENNINKKELYQYTITKKENSYYEKEVLYFNTNLLSKRKFTYWTCLYYFYV